MNRNSLKSALSRLLAVALVLAGLVGCGENSQKPKDSPNMFMSGGEFTRGRDHGRRDAKWALIDHSGAWMWTWMVSDQYRQGYQQGWTEGRAEVRFNKEQEQAKQDTRQNESTDTTE